MNLETKIIPSLKSEYPNALHAQFNDRLYEIVGKVQPQLINLPQDMYANWRKLIDLEISINAEIAANAKTKYMVEKDGMRDGQISYLFDDIRNNTRSPFAEKKEAAEKLVLIVNKFTGLQTQAYDVETSNIKSLLKDLRSSENAPLCKVLGLDELINLLEKTNNEFDNIKADRTTERTEGNLPQSRAARKQTDEICDNVCKVLEVAYLICTHDDGKKQILALIGEMNQYIAETKTTYRQMQAAGKSEDNKPEDAPTEATESND